ncbi:hypothetical protein F4777DRAFT_571666 [Nemania sp. FL0916]|nr:hypothetical protein F4777DRAFT_571666 [Nemania sp. FL0916]
MSSTQWSLLAFRLETTTPDTRADALYANGRMQVPVIISIRAWNSSTQTVYQLSDLELNRIELIDYDAPTTGLADGWSYSATRNELFSNAAAARNDVSTNTASHSLTQSLTQSLKSLNPTSSFVEGSVDKSISSSATSDDTPQKKRYLVSTTRVENKRIGARIQLPDGTMVTTTTSPFNFFITLVGNPPVVYTTDTINVARVTVDKGEKTVGVWNQSGNMVSSSRMPWSQDNYYISSSVHDFVKAEIHGFNATGTGADHLPDSRLANIFHYWSNNTGNLRLSFIWEFGTEETRAVGLYRETGSPNTTRIEAFEDIKINKKRNALCLTRLGFNWNSNIWGTNWSSDNTGFTVYDRFGNMGTFYAVWVEDEDVIVIQDSNL